METGLSVHGRDRAGLANSVVLREPPRRRAAFQAGTSRPAARSIRAAPDRSARVELHSRLWAGSDSAGVRDVRVGHISEPGDGKGSGLSGQGAVDSAAGLGDRLLLLGLAG